MLNKSRKIMSILLIIAPCFITNLCAEVEANVSLKIDNIFQQVITPDSPGCAVSVINNGTIVFSKGYGLANLELNSPISKKSAFYVASMSKQFTALSVLMASRLGLFSLEDNIRKYTPEIPEYDKPITIRHLIYHTSGLRDYISLLDLSGVSTDGVITEEYVIALLSRQQNLAFTPGTEFRYSNSGYFLLGVIIKRATGLSLREFAEKHIFNPLGMHNTFFFDNHREIVTNRTQGHERLQGKTFEKVQTSFDLVGSGGLITTVEDIALFDSNTYSNILEKESQDLMIEYLKPGFLDNGIELENHYGFGLRVDSYKGNKRVLHSGIFIGFNSQYVRFPEQKISVVCLCNIANFGASSLAHKVADLFLLDMTLSQHKIVSKDSPSVNESTKHFNVTAKNMKQWVGHYWDDSFPMGAFEINFSDGKLQLYVPAWQASFELIPVSENEYTILNGHPMVNGSTFTFFSDTDGKQVNLALRNGWRWSLHNFSYYSPELSDIERTVGTFASSELAVLSHIKFSNEKFYLQMGYGTKTEMVPITKDVFQLDGNMMIFHRQEDGLISGFILSTPAARGLKFRRAAKN